MLAFETRSEDLTDIDGRKGFIASDNTPITYSTFRMFQSIFEGSLYTDYDYWKDDTLPKGIPITLINSHFPIIKFCVFGNCIAYTLRRFVKIEWIDHNWQNDDEASKHLTVNDISFSNEIKSTISASGCNYDYQLTVNQINLLTEIFLKTRVWEVDELSLRLYKKEISKFKHFKYEQSLELYKELRSNDGNKDIFEKLFLSNLKFVFHIAKSYQNRGLLLNDLISEGNLGLIDGIRKFDWSRGFHDTVFLAYSIRAAIMKAVNNYGNILHYPANVIAIYAKIKKETLKFESEHEYEPSCDMLSELLGIPQNKIEDSLGLAEDCISLDCISEYIDDFDAADTFINQAISNTPSNFITLPCEYPNWCEDEEYLHKTIQTALKILNENERNVVTMYFGLDRSREPMELSEIAESMGVTQERARQIKESACRKLRKSTLLQSYYGKDCPQSSDHSKHELHYTLKRMANKRK